MEKSSLRWDLIVAASCISIEVSGGSSTCLKYAVPCKACHRQQRFLLYHVPALVHFISLNIIDYNLQNLEHSRRLPKIPLNVLALPVDGCLQVASICLLRDDLALATLPTSSTRYACSPPPASRSSFIHPSNVLLEYCPSVNAVVIEG